ncbi:MAG: fibronectin type III domain-containing protein, partial [Coriobacteriia bacterium]|nr:fibronectin type III domain-containing protein [Coriobacteriia bacterium]
MMGTFDTGWYNRWQGSSSAVRAVCQYSSSSTASAVSVSAYTETWWRYWNSWSDGDDSYGQVAIDYPLGTAKTSATKQVRPNNSNGSGVNGGNTSTVTFSFARGTSAYSVYVRCRCYNNGMPADTGWHTAATISVPVLPTPAAPTNCTHVRNSDTQNTVSWTRAETTSNPYRYLLVERRANAGSWTQIAQVDGSLSSYTDNTSQANASYQYRIRAEFHGMYSSYSAATTPTYNTPAQPGKPSASRQADNSVVISFGNTGVTQTLTRLQRSVDNASWADVKTASGDNVTTFTDAPGGGTFYYRVRNERDALTSAWSA